MRIGMGYDIHKLCEGRNLVLGGVKIPYDKGLLGHSDADVLIHAIIDAILGSVALRDIGYHFPDTDEKYKNANSIALLKEALKMLKDEGYKIVNIDSTVIAQKPKLSNYINLMRETLSIAIGIDINLISIKAKTNEQMDSQGQELSISANAIVLVDSI